MNGIKNINEIKTGRISLKSLYGENKFERIKPVFRNTIIQ